MNRTAVAVSGLNTVPIGVRVKGGYDSADPLNANMPMVAHLQRTGGTGRMTYLVSADLPRVSGTTQNGEWAGLVNVPSTANGTFKVIGVTTGPFSLTVNGTPIDPTPFNGPALSVTGYHLPKITAVGDATDRAVRIRLLDHLGGDRLGDRKALRDADSR